MNQEENNKKENNKPVFKSEEENHEFLEYLTNLPESKLLRFNEEQLKSFIDNEKDEFSKAEVVRLILAKEKIRTISQTYESVNNRIKVENFLKFEWGFLTVLALIFLTAYIIIFEISNYVTIGTMFSTILILGLKFVSAAVMSEKTLKKIKKLMKNSSDVTEYK